MEDKLNFQQLKNNQKNAKKMERFKWIAITILSNLIILFFFSPSLTDVVEISKRPKKNSKSKENHVRIEIPLSLFIPLGDASYKNRSLIRVSLFNSKNRQIVASAYILNLETGAPSSKVDSLINDNDSKIYVIDIANKDLKKIISEKNTPFKAYPYSQIVSHKPLFLGTKYEITF